MWRWPTTGLSISTEKHWEVSDSWTSKGSRDAQEELTRLYHPLLVREAIVDGIFDEDLYQEFCATLLHCIKEFDF